MQSSSTSLHPYNLSNERGVKVLPCSRCLWKGRESGSYQIIKTTTDGTTHWFQPLTQPTSICLGRWESDGFADVKWEENEEGHKGGRGKRERGQTDEEIGKNKEEERTFSEGVELGNMGGRRVLRWDLAVCVIPCQLKGFLHHLQASCRDKSADGRKILSAGSDSSTCFQQTLSEIVTDWKDETWNAVWIQSSAASTVLLETKTLGEIFCHCLFWTEASAQWRTLM